MLKIKLLPVLLLMALFPCINLFAQSNEEVYQGFQFNFFPPGARAMAMGGAFIGLADDATAAYSNPAGMVILTKPEVSAVVKLSNYTTLRAADWDSFTTGTLTEFSDGTLAGLGFASVVIPYGNFSFGLSMTNFIDYEESFTLVTRPIPGTGWAFYPAVCTMDLNGNYYSASIAYRASDAFSVGATVNIVSYAVTTSTVLRDFGWDYTDVSQPIVNSAYVDATDTGIGFTAGILFTPSPKISIGAVYSMNPKVQYAQSMYTGANEKFYSEIELTMDIPDRFGAGIAFRPSDELVVIADVIMVQYSQISENYISTYLVDGDAVDRGDDISSFFDTSDTTEIHVGAEYALMMGKAKTPLFIRAGFFTNPEHRPYYSGNGLGEEYRWNLKDYSDQIKSTEIGITFGVGTVISQKLQIDVAYVISDSLNEGVISAVYHF